MSGRAGPRWRDEACTRAGGRHRKARPVFRKRLGCIFRSRPQPENASRSERGIWDAVSAKDRKRKAHPILTPDSGSRFPKRPQSGKRIPLWSQIPGRNFRRALNKRKGPLCRGPSQFKVAGKGIASARCADGPLRRLRALRAALANAYAFTQLRALMGSIPCGGCIKEKDPFTEVLVNSRWRGRESNP